MQIIIDLNNLDEVKSDAEWIVNQIKNMSDEELRDNLAYNPQEIQNLSREKILHFISTRRTRMFRYWDPDVCRWAIFTDSLESLKTGFDDDVGSELWSLPVNGQAGSLGFFTFEATRLR